MAVTYKKRFHLLIDKRMTKQFQHETASAVAEESLGTITAGFGRFTGEKLVEMVLEVFE